MNVLIIEDEKDLSEAISSYLTKAGFLCECAFTFEEAYEKVNLYSYDCILIDIGLPDGSGLDVIERLKKIKSNSGIIVISARNSLDDKIFGLQIGADDYMTKPFNLSELSARISALIRRKGFQGRTEINFNELKIIPSERIAFVNKNEIRLTKKEFDLLVYFVSNPRIVITKESIAEHLWGDNMDMSDSFDFLYAHIKNLRRKIAQLGGDNYIHAIYGIGYKFILD